MVSKAEEVLDKVIIAAPCTVSWDSMVGDNTSRLCSGCSRNVYNLSDMTAREAKEFLQKNGVKECLTFYRRSDGTIMTDNCPRGLRAIREQYRKVQRKAAILASSILATFVSFMPVTKAQENPWKTVDENKLAGDCKWGRPENKNKPKDKSSDPASKKKAKETETDTDIDMPLGLPAWEPSETSLQQVSGNIKLSLTKDPVIPESVTPGTESYPFPIREWPLNASQSKNNIAKNKTVMMDGDQCRDSSSTAGTMSKQILWEPMFAGSRLRQETSERETALPLRQEHRVVEYKPYPFQHYFPHYDGVAKQLSAETESSRVHQPDNTVFALYTAARENEANASFLLAATQYRQALKIAQKQKHDEKLLRQIRGSYENLQRKLESEGYRTLHKD